MEFGIFGHCSVFEHHHFPVDDGFEMCEDLVNRITAIDTLLILTNAQRLLDLFSP